MNKYSNIESEQHLFELLPRKCIADIARGGQNYPECKTWLDKLSLKIPRHRCLDILSSSWEEEELKQESDEELNIKVLWLAAWYGS